MFLEEIANRLTLQNVGGLNVSIFLTSQSRLPAGDGPYITLSETGGAGAARTQTSATPRPTAQVLIRGKNPSEVRAMSWAAYYALGGPDGLWNVTLDGVFYISLVARQEPTDIGADSVGRSSYSFNIDAEKQRS